MSANPLARTAILGVAALTACGLAGAGAAMTYAASAPQASVRADLGDSVTVPNYIVAGDRLVSKNKTYKLTMQTDGNLVLRGAADKLLWASNSSAKGGERLVLDDNGNMSIQTGKGVKIWETKTANSGATLIRVHDDGNVILSAGLKLVWQTGTSQVDPVPAPTVTTRPPLPTNTVTTRPPLPTNTVTTRPPLPTMTATSRPTVPPVPMPTRTTFVAR